MKSSRRCTDGVCYIEEVLTSISPHTILSVVFSPDGKRIFSGSLDTTIRVWDAETGSIVVNSFRGHADCIFPIACSPNGKRILSRFADNTIRNGMQGQAISCQSLSTGTLIASPLWRALLTASASPWGLWTGRLGCGMQRQGTCQAHLKDTSPVTSVAFSPNGKTMGLQNQGMGCRERECHISLSQSAHLSSHLCCILTRRKTHCLGIFRQDHPYVGCGNGECHPSLVQKAHQGSYLCCILMANILFRA